ncbi:unnamed protein product [Parascedosporium putredinis]|uniref:Uncharacterized protein n=1 Tax=Parascedosporium putredinis TaxID=1442378 RepID=A0A9P1GZQ4_9PEZI|nr:unnamed protein product [Parascedosporium putredinis]CAI7991999.1 unnamed protein product [Parascedosporium putredinis]
MKRLETIIQCYDIQVTAGADEVSAISSWISESVEFERRLNELTTAKVKEADAKVKEAGAKADYYWNEWVRVGTAANAAETKIQEASQAIEEMEIIELDKMDAHYTSQYNEMEGRHNRELAARTRHFSDEIKKLETLMATTGSNYAAMPDPDLQRYSRAVDTDLDPTGYLTRAGQGDKTWTNFLKSLCWRILIEGFFYYPLGFGALGVNGQDAFAAVYPLLAETKAGETNELRAHIFERILRQVKGTLRGNPEGLFSGLFRSNASKVTETLIDALQRASGGLLDKEASTEIADVVEKLGILALEMGSQRAQVYLESCENGSEQVVPGPKFDCAGTDVLGARVVDIMTQPCLARAGDGRDNSKVRKVIVREASSHCVEEAWAVKPHYYTFVFDVVTISRDVDVGRSLGSYIPSWVIMPQGPRKGGYESVLNEEM